VLSALKNPQALRQLASSGSGSDGLSLQGNTSTRGNARTVRPSQKIKYSSNAAAASRAFFGSIWDNTGGAVGRSYNRYYNRVGQSLDTYYDNGGKSVTGA